MRRPWSVLLVGAALVVSVPTLPPAGVDAAGTAMRPGATLLVSGSTPPGVGDPETSAPAISADGSTVAFSTTPSGPQVNPNGVEDARSIEVRDVVTRQGTAVGNPAWDSTAPSLSGDGRTVAFSATYAEQQRGGRLADGDLYVSRLRQGAPPANRPLTGTNTDLRYQRLVGCEPRLDSQATRTSDRCGPQLSSDGRSVAFPAALSLVAPKLVVSVSPPRSDVFLDPDEKALSVVDFGNAATQRVVSLTVSGPHVAEISGVRVSGSGAASFSVGPAPTGTFCNRFTLRLGSGTRTCTMEIALVRGRACGAVLARLEIDSPTPRGRTATSLVGVDADGCATGAPTPTLAGCTPFTTSTFPGVAPDLGANTPVQNFGELAVGDTAVVAQRVVNSSTTTTRFVDFASSDCAQLQLVQRTVFGAPQACWPGLAVAAGEQCIAYVQFRPSQVSPVSAVVTLTEASIGIGVPLPPTPVQAFTFAGAGTQRAVVVRRDTDGDGAFTGPADPPARVVSLDAQRAQVDGETPSLSADGRYVAFASRVNGGYDQTQILVHDTDRAGDRSYAPGPTVVASQLGPGEPTLPDLAFQPSISGDGNRLAFVSLRAGVEGAPPDVQVHVRDLARDRTVIASAPLGSTQGADRPSLAPALSADGSTVAFVSKALDLAPTRIVPNDQAVYVRDLGPDFGAAGVPGAHLVSLRVDEDATRAPSGLPAISSDGDATAFVSLDRILSEVSSPNQQVYLRASSGSLEVSPVSIGFPPDEVGIGVTSKPIGVTVQNKGLFAVAIDASGTADFLVRPAETCALLPPRASCVVHVRFKPTRLSERTGTIQVSGKANGVGVATELIVATGRPTSPRISYAPAVAREGEVTFVTGTGFLPGLPVELLWGRGPVAVPVVVPDESGAFRVPVVILKGPGAGPRALTVSMPSVGDSFLAPPLLVVVGSQQPPDFLARN